MAIAFVKGGGNHNESSSAVSYAFTGDVTANSLITIVVGKTQDGATDPIIAGDVTKTAGTATIGSISLDVTDVSEDWQSTYDSYSAILSCLVTGTGTLTLTFNSGGIYQAISAGEWTGNWDASRVEDTASADMVSDIHQSGNATSDGAALFVGGEHIVCSDETIDWTYDGAFSQVHHYIEQLTAAISQIYRIVGSYTEDSADWEINHTMGASPCLVVYKEGSATPTITQEGYRWRNDDGDQANATWAASQDTGITAPANSVRRLRVLLDTSGDANAANYQLEYKEANDANWTVLST